LDKVELFFKLSFKFFKKYLQEYLILLLKPVAIGVLGMFVLALGFVNPIFAIFALFITIPCIFYSFWRGIMITYALNPLADDFIKKGQMNLADCYSLVRKDEKQLGLWISYVAIVSALGFIPSLVAVSILNPVPFSSLFSSPSGAISFLSGCYTKSLILIYLLNMLILVPFLNFSQQAFYFRKPDENFLDLSLNCYKKLNLTGFLIAFIVVFLGSKMSSDSVLILFTPVFNVFIYPLNFFWYLSVKNKC